MCGVVGVFSLEGQNADIPQKLEALLRHSRNRWQKWYGVAVLSEWKLIRHVSAELSWVSEALKKYKWKTELIIGHARYPTSWGDEWGDAKLQPFEVKSESLSETGHSFAFNGNIVNADIIAEGLKKEWFVFEHTPILDTEVLKFMILKKVREGVTDLKEILEYIHNKIDGCCNIILINKEWDMAVAKDKWGFRPLEYGVKDGLLFVASESTALMKIGCEKVDHISGWEILLINKGDAAHRIERMKIEEPVTKQRCFFEAVYFADPRTLLWWEAASAYRYRFWQVLAEQDLGRFDPENTIIVDIPASSEDAAKWYADKIGIERVQAIIKKPQSKRTFIDDPATRKDKVKEKYVFNPELKPFLKWKKVVLMDDSIVRWTTLEHLVQAFKKFYEPSEIHVRIPSPPVIAPCFYGMNMAEVETLKATKYFKDIKNPTEAELRTLWKSFWATSLRYLTPPSLVSALKMHVNHICLACVTAQYPTPCGQATYDKQIEAMKV